MPVSSFDVGDRRGHFGAKAIADGSGKDLFERKVFSRAWGLRS